MSSRDHVRLVARRHDHVNGGKLQFENFRRAARCEHRAGLPEAAMQRDQPEPREHRDDGEDHAGHHPGRPEPRDRVPHRGARRTRAVAEFGLGLRGREEHDLARHPQMIARHQRLDLGDAGETLEGECERVEHTAVEPDARRLAACLLGNEGEQVGQREVLRAEDVALADAALARGQARDPPRRHRRARC